MEAHRGRQTLHSSTVTPVILRFQHTQVLIVALLCHSSRGVVPLLQMMLLFQQYRGTECRAVLSEQSVYKSVIMPAKLDGLCPGR